MLDLVSEMEGKYLITHTTNMKVIRKTGLGLCYKWLCEPPFKIFATGSLHCILFQQRIFRQKGQKHGRFFTLDLLDFYAHFEQFGDVQEVQEVQGGSLVCSRPEICESWRSFMASFPR